jgi:SAM-dependent methyltransferase
MMSHLYGYSDYHGPNTVLIAEDEVEDDATTNPLQAGFWMEGDSLAPPCGTARSTIHEILERLHITAADVLYDLGCGDGRVCLEAWHIYHCRAIGVEVERDLVDRAEVLIASAKDASRGSSPLPQVYCMDLRRVFLEWFQEDGPSDDFPLPTIVFLYLLPDSLLEMESQFGKLLHVAPKCRLVCNSWGISHWKALQEETIRESSGVLTKVYVYTRESVPTEHINSNE